MRNEEMPRVRVDSSASDMPAGAGQRFDLSDYITPQAILQLGGSREDAAGTAFALRALTDIYARSFDIKYPDLKARQILPIYSGVDAGAEGYRWQQYDRTGNANVVDDYAADLPQAEVFMAEYQSRIYGLGTSYMYSIQDLRKARMAGMPLESREAFAARRAMEQAVEQWAFFGNQAVPTGGATVTGQALKNAPAAVSTTDYLYAYGFTNFPGIVANTTTNNWTLPSTSVSTIVNDFNTLQKSIVVGSDGIHSPDTLVLPLSQWANLATIPRSVTFTDDTVIQYLRKQSPWLKNIYFTPMLENAGKLQNGTTPGPRIMMFEKNEENIQLVIPLEFEQLPPQMINLMFKIPCYMRIGGIRCSYPKSIAYLDGASG